MLQDHTWTAHTAPGACIKHAPGAVCIQIMLMEHNRLRIFFQIINGPGAAGSGSYVVQATSRGQNLKKESSLLYWLYIYIPKQYLILLDYITVWWCIPSFGLLSSSPDSEEEL